MGAPRPPYRHQNSVSCIKVFGFVIRRKYCAIFRRGKSALPKLLGRETKLGGGEAKLGGGEAKLGGGEAKLGGGDLKIVPKDLKLVPKDLKDHGGIAQYFLRITSNDFPMPSVGAGNICTNSQVSSRYAHYKTLPCRCFADYILAISGNGS